MAVGTAVDYGYFKFYQVWLRFLSTTPLRLGFSWAKLGVHSQGWSSGEDDLMMINRCFGHLWASGPLCRASVTLTGDGEVACSLSYSAVWAGGGL